MNAVVLERHGPPHVLRMKEVAEPRPAPDEVVVALEAIGINYAEILSRKGLYGWAPELPYTPGMEGAGRVEQVGDEVRGLARGQRVIVGAQYGAYAQRIAVPAAQALPAPPDFSIEECAAFGVNYLTAWVSLFEMARLRPSDRVLVTAAAGGVGTAAVQLATRFGCTTFGMAGSDDKLERVRNLGAADGINYRREGFARRLRETTAPEGIDVVLELVGGEVYRAVWPALAPFGRVVSAGFASLDLQRWNPLSWWRTWRDLPRADVRTLAPGSHGLLATHLGYLLPQAERLRGVWEDMTAFTEAHGIRPVVGETVPFERIADAHRLIESRRTVGKVVVRIPRAGAAAATETAP